MNWSSNDTDYTVEKRWVDGSSFNTKSTITSFFKKYETATSAISKYKSMCVMIYVSY